MAINRLRVRDTMVNRGIAAEAPAMEFADVLDDEIDSALSGFATKQDLQIGLERQTEIIMRYIADQATHQLRWTFGITVGVAAITVAIISILVAVS